MRRGLVLSAVLAALVAGTLALAPAASAATGQPGLRLVSHTPDGGYPNAETIDVRGITPDGRYGIFSSAASDLVSNDTNNAWDAFVEDLDTGALTRVSDGNGGTALAISDDGTRVLWRGSGSIYVTDLVKRKTTKINVPKGAYFRAASDDLSVLLVQTSEQADPATQINHYYLVTRNSSTLVDATSSGQPSRGASDSASLSGDGTTVVYASHDPALDPSVSSDRAGLFRWRRSGGSKLLLVGGVNLSPGGLSRTGDVVTAQDDDGTAWLVTSTRKRQLSGRIGDLTPDGRYTMISVPQPDGSADAMRVDTGTGASTPANVSATGARLGNVGVARLSADGNAAFLLTNVDGVVPGVVRGIHLYRRDIAAGVTELVCCNVSSPSRTGNIPLVDARGDRALFVSATALDAADAQSFPDLFSWTRPPVRVGPAVADETAGTVEVPIALNAPATSSTRVAWQPVGTWSGLSGEPGVVEIPAGATSTTITLTIADDDVYSGDRSYGIRVALPEQSPSPYNVGWVVITDDEVPQVSIADAQAVENAGTMTFTVQLDNTSTRPVSVAWSTAVDGEASSVNRATPDSDFAAAAGTVTIPPGWSSATVRISLLNDVVPELDETFLVTLSKPTGAAVTRGTARGTIRDDDLPLPELGL